MNSITRNPRSWLALRRLLCVGQHNARARMNTEAVLKKTCETGALCAAIGLTASAIWLCGAEFLRLRKARAVQMPSRIEHDPVLKSRVSLLITPGAKLDLFRAVLQQYEQLDSNAADFQTELNNLKTAFQTYFDASKIAMINVPSFGRVPVSPKLRSAYCMLLLSAYASAPTNPV